MTRLAFLSTPSARRATRHRHRAAGLDEISIHALREEGDKVAPYVFLAVHISIHALREEGDPPPAASPRPARHFYPRPPRGGRLEDTQLFIKRLRFLSTPSARRATIDLLPNLTPEQFLSTPSARRATRAGCFRDCLSVYFYPRPPRGGRPARERAEKREARFLSTPSARRATGKSLMDTEDGFISIHALREEGDTPTLGFAT